MRLFDKLLSLKKKKRKNNNNDIHSGYAVVKYDPMRQRNYWETFSTDGDDAMSMSGGQPLSIDPTKVPLGTRVDLYVPELPNGK